MAVNWKLLKNQLSYIFETNPPDSESDAAKKITDAYVASISTGTTLLQNQVIKYNKVILQNSLHSSFLIARTTGKPNLKIMASGFVGFWTAAQFNPLPPHPPTISPSPIVPNCVVTYPGDVVSLETQLKVAFSNFPGKKSSLTINMLILALKTHLTTISGIYNGMIPGVPVPTPSPPIPWIGVV